MARASLTTPTTTDFKTVIAPTAATVDGDIIDVGARLYVNNGSGAPINVTVQCTASTSGLDVEDLVVPVAAGQSALIGPLPKSLFAQASDAVVGAGRALVDYSAITSVTRAAVPG